MIFEKLELKRQSRLRASRQLRSSTGPVTRIAAPDFPLPVSDVLVVGAVRSHRRNTKGKRRKTVIYRVEQVRALERAARTLKSALLRVIVQTELRKLYAGLRNDDAIWDSPTSWRTDGEGGRNDYMYGEACKTKATEITSARLNETMPWISPLTWRLPGAIRLASRRIEQSRTGWCRRSRRIRCTIPAKCTCWKAAARCN
jgi:hypothetical protein